MSEGGCSFDDSVNEEVVRRSITAEVLLAGSNYRQPAKIEARRWRISAGLLHGGSGTGAIDLCVPDCLSPGGDRS